MGERRTARATLSSPSALTQIRAWLCLHEGPGLCAVRWSAALRERRPQWARRASTSISTDPIALLSRAAKNWKSRTRSSRLTAPSCSHRPTASLPSITSCVLAPLYLPLLLQSTQMTSQKKNAPSYAHNFRLFNWYAVRCIMHGLKRVYLLSNNCNMVKALLR